jgi:hypothetical protein
MKDTKRPDGPESRPATDATPKRLGASDLAKLAVALLGTIGVGSLVNALRGRSARVRQEQAAQQQDQAAQQQAEALDKLRDMGHEGDNVGVGRIALVAVALMLVVAVALLAAGGVFAFFADRAEQADASVPPLAQTAQLPPAPRLQVAPAADLATLRATAQARLDSYGWVDQQAGVVHIPINQAMTLIAQRGLPTRSPGAQNR